MGTQFGRWHRQSGEIDRSSIAAVRSYLEKSAPDGEGIFDSRHAVVVHRAFHTTKESHLDHQPIVSNRGRVVTFDGRLDNRDDLFELLGRPGRDQCRLISDGALVAAAYERWEKDALSRLVGDWALSVYDPEGHTLLLAKDFIGTNSLYFRESTHEVVWSSLLEPLLITSSDAVSLDEEYLAGWLSFYPASDKTPYREILAVPPCCWVEFKPDKREIRRYWSFSAGKTIRYSSDAEYEQHFRSLLQQAVRRRLRADSPVVSELSGGMDSSTIVCTADELLDGGRELAPGLFTVSFFDPCEPNWDELPYFTRVEQRRGQIGLHIEINLERALSFPTKPDRLSPVPASIFGEADVQRQLQSYMDSLGSRVLLSGVGGDEFTGGVPTPTPELADLLCARQPLRWWRQLHSWALSQRRPCIHLVYETLRIFLWQRSMERRKHTQLAAWIPSELVKRQARAFAGYEARSQFFGPRPSFQENLTTLDVLRRQLACHNGWLRTPRDVRYPFLDRDLLEFLFAIPREQIVRPQQRRSLMRRALVGHVPDEILNRRRKAYVARGPQAALSKLWRQLQDKPLISDTLGLLHLEAATAAIERARSGQSINTVAMVRTLMMELWLRQLSCQGILRVTGDLKLARSDRNAGYAALATTGSPIS